MSFGEWIDRAFIMDRPYVGGRFMDRGFPDALDWSEPSGVIVRQTLAGTARIWRPFSESKAPVDMQGVTATISEYELTEGDFLHIQALRRKADVFYYADGRPVQDVFLGVSGGDELRLPRPLASGIVTGLDDTLFPTRVYLDGVEDASAASISGQVVTVNSAGDELRIEYTPAYVMILTTGAMSISEYNSIQYDGISMVEVIQSGDNAGNFHA